MEEMEKVDAMTVADEAVKNRRFDAVRVVDARMGRGKTSAAIRYMDENAGKKRFIYVTPYLDEVGRICDACGFDQPDDESSTKLTTMKKLMHKGKNISTTHALFYSMDDECIDLIQSMGYCLIVDESLNVLSKSHLQNGDVDILTRFCTTQNEDGTLTWTLGEYDGMFSSIMSQANHGSLHYIDGFLYNLMSPELLASFSEVWMLTYLFDGQLERAYLEYFDIPYEIWGIDTTDGHRFAPGPDKPEPIDYSELIDLVLDENLNKVGNDRFALSKSSIEGRQYRDKYIRTLRGNLNRFMRDYAGVPACERIWTTFKSCADLLDQRDHRHRRQFLQVSARATNEYRNCSALAYMANRFVDPNYPKFFARRGVNIDHNQFALSELLQWVWRSRIRDGKPIKLYIPSSRMRKLLTDWIEENKGEN